MNVKESRNTPPFRRHRGTGQGYVTLDGRRIYLGRFDLPATQERYDRLVAEWLANGRRLPVAVADITVTELVASFWEWAQGYYVKHGRPTPEVAHIKTAMAPLRRLYGRTPAAEFGPLKLRTIRETMIARKRYGRRWSRGFVNEQVGRIKRLFKWGVSREIVPPGVFHGLQSIDGLRRGRSAARETEPVRPVPEEYVEAIRPFVARPIWALIQVQLLTGCRPGEAAIMRGGDLDMTGRIWLYTPSSHKTEHHGKSRVIYLEPRAQTVVREFLRSDVNAYLFSPAEAETVRNTTRRQARQSPMTPSQRRRTEAARRRTRQRPPGDHYTTDTYRRAVERACDLADRAAKESKGLPLDGERIVPRWTPHRLRHTAATRLRKEFGIEAARIILGHSSPAMTDLYAEIDRGRALEVMSKIG